MMNIYGKLQAIRVALQNMNLKKSGRNKHIGYNYYELGDFLPAINQLMLENQMTSAVTFNNEMAKLTLINCEKPEETIVFESPMRDAVLKNAHPVQNLGATETYSRRYLYMAAFEIVESDVIDASQGADNTPPPQRPKSLLSQETREALNTALASYTKLTSYKMNDVVTKLQKELNKKMSEFTEQDAKKVLDLIQEWQTAFMAELGV